MRSLVRESVLIFNNKEKDEIVNSLAIAEDYLKVRFESHVEYESSCLSHCASHGLSNFKDPDLQRRCSKPHDTTCFDCFNLSNTMATIKSKVDSLNNDRIDKKDLMHRVQEAEIKVKDWQKHLLRANQQGKAKSDVMEIIKNNPDSALLVRDFAQKILPCCGMESQKDYFSKAGMSCHGDVVLMYDPSKGWIKAVYYTLFDKADQDAIDVLSITEEYAKEFSKNFPSIVYLYVKSDNAGSYHNCMMVEGVKNIFEKYGIKLVRYDYNEPQKGKCCCDREFALLKSIIIAYLNSNRLAKITNAIELANVIMAEGGPKNTRVIVVSIDKQSVKVVNKPKSIKNISKYHSYVVEQDGIRYFEYYKIGNGKLISYKNITFQSATEVQMQWKESTRQGLNIVQTQHNTNYSCTNNLCKFSTNSEAELLTHESEGKHDIIKKTQNDWIRELFVELKYSSISNRNEQQQLFSQLLLDEEEMKSYCDSYPPGWGRPVVKYKRFTPAQKNFVKTIFDQGEKNKENKKSPVQIQELMVKELGLAGSLSVTQISGLITVFSRNTEIDHMEDTNDADLVSIFEISPSNIKINLFSQHSILMHDIHDESEYIRRQLEALEPDSMQVNLKF